MSKIADNTLDRHSPLHKVVKCLLDECEVLSSNENIYADDVEGTNISIEEVNVIINHLTHGNEWSAIQYSDSFEDSSEDRASIRYSIRMYKENIVGYRRKMFAAAKEGDYDNVVYWAESIMEREELIKSKEAQL